jgi:hypothetical protein
MDEQNQIASTPITPERRRRRRRLLVIIILVLIAVAFFYFRSRNSNHYGASNSLPSGSGLGGYGDYGASPMGVAH